MPNCTIRAPSLAMRVLSTLLDRFKLPNQDDERVGANDNHAQTNHPEGFGSRCDGRVSK